LFVFLVLLVVLPAWLAVRRVVAVNRRRAPGVGREPVLGETPRQLRSDLWLVIAVVAVVIAAALLKIRP
jgi:hypothetical protein